jgi:predicted transcriptional regulator
VLEEKGQLRHEEQGLRYVYVPKLPRQKIQQSALKHLVDTLFEGSAEKVVAALLGKGASQITDEQLERMSAMIEDARKEGKRR